MSFQYTLFPSTFFLEYLTENTFNIVGYTNDPYYTDIELEIPGDIPSGDFNPAGTVVAIAGGTYDPTKETYGNGVFSGNTSIKTITFANPSYITSFAYNTFNNMPNLKSFTMPDSITSIETSYNNSIFAGCISLTSIVLSNQLTNIPGYFFNSPDNDDGGINNILCGGCNITIPPSVTLIGEDAFLNIFVITIENPHTTGCYYSVEASGLTYKYNYSFQLTGSEKSYGTANFPSITSKGDLNSDWQNTIGVFTVVNYGADVPSSNVNEASEEKPACFAEGSNIRCINENESEILTKIEDLKIGDKYSSLKYGPLKIFVIGIYEIVTNPCENINYIKKTNSNGLKEKLIVSDSKCILVESHLEKELFKSEFYNPNNSRFVYHFFY